MQLPSLTVHANCSDLKMLEECLEEELMVAPMEKKRIVIRDKNIFAHSRRFYPTALHWMDEKRLWILTLIRID